jgi:ubiquinone/menaquinone biosynthesis C-methylase UbiE
LNQDKAKEIEFFDRHAQADEYNVFSAASNERLIGACLRIGGLQPPGKIADLGCGSGVFSSILAEKSFQVTGVDLSPGMIEMAGKKYPKAKYNVSFKVGDVEALDFADASFDGVLLSGLLHHLPDPSACIREVHRILKPGGVFMAFDPNRMNPFMYLYRDRSSPFYSPKGVTENERPVLAKPLAQAFRTVGFEAKTDYLSNLQYQYIASRPMRILLPIYNFIDSAVFALPFLRPMRAFVITTGRKLPASP